MKNSVVYIYALKDPETKEVRYIGKTINVQKRLRDHISEAKRKIFYRRKDNWLRSILSKGNTPLVEIIEICTLQNWQHRERYWIKHYSQFSNLTNHADGGQGRSGFKHTPETIAKIRKSNTGKKRTSEQIKQIIKQNQKPISQYSLDGIWVRDWSSGTKAAKGIGLCNSSGISLCLKGKYKQAGGYIWRYK